MLRCGQSLRAMFAVRYTVVTGALCVESGVRVLRVPVSDCLQFHFAVLCCAILFCAVLRCVSRAVLRCVMLRSGQSLRADRCRYIVVAGASKVECGCRGFGLQFCFALFCACHSVPCCAPLRHAAQWAVVTCGFAVGTLWWQVRCPSEVECVCRGCRTACTSGSYVLLICAVLCCAVVGAGCRFGALCWQIRCFVLAGAL
jgi:hypothetical protein